MRAPDERFLLVWETPGVQHNFVAETGRTLIPDKLRLSGASLAYLDHPPVTPRSKGLESLP
jgi:hypothetical protein